MVIAIPLTTTAAEISLMPSIDIRGEYDDNVTYSRFFKTSDYLARISPAFELDYTTELLDLQSKVAFDILRYKDETHLDTENQRYELSGEYRLMERISVSGNGSYVKDTTLESEIEDTGLADNPRQDRERYTGGMGFSYMLSEVWDVGVNYSHTKTEYEWERNTDYDVDSISFSFNHRFNNQLDIFTIQPYYYFYESDISEVNNYGLSLGWVHPFSETLALTAFLGARYTKTEYDYIYTQYILGIPIPIPVDEEESGWNGVADINLKKTGETYSATIGYNQDLSYSSYGEPIERYKVYCNADRKITERLFVKFSGNIYFTKSDGDLNDRDNRYYSVSPSLNYKITETHSLQLAYRYEKSEQKELANNRDRDRNRVWLALKFRFPRKW